jgi:hypothetical protein
MVVAICDHLTELIGQDITDCDIQLEVPKWLLESI